jgi:hypothetical protein
VSPISLPDPERASRTFCLMWRDYSCFNSKGL